MFAKSNQYVPLAGVPTGLDDVPPNSPKSTSALTTYTLLETPNSEYAANSPYSFVSAPCNILPDESEAKVGFPNVAVNSLCEEIAYTDPTVELVVPAAVPDPVPDVLFLLVATNIIGVIPRFDTA